jgi:uncharacterized integral membrane protein
MANPAENRPASRSGATDPPMPELPADLAPPAPERTVHEPSAMEPVSEPTAPAGGRRIGEPPAPKAKVQLGRTRTSAVWFGVWAGVAGVILLIIFVAQNTSSVQINFLWLSGSISLALALLIAGVAGAAVAMGVAAARIIQLRRLLRRSR